MEKATASCRYVPARPLRSRRSTWLDLPHTELVTMGGWAFSAATPDLWNSLSDKLRNASYVKSFKTDKKTFYNKHAFPSSPRPLFAPTTPASPGFPLFPHHHLSFFLIPYICLCWFFDVFVLHFEILRKTAIQIKCIYPSTREVDIYIVELVEVNSAYFCKCFTLWRTLKLFLINWTVM